MNRLSQPPLRGYGDYSGFVMYLGVPSGGCGSFDRSMRRTLSFSCSRPTTREDHPSLPSSSRPGIIRRPYSSNPRFFTYLALPCIMLLCTLGEFISAAQRVK